MATYELTSSIPSSSSLKTGDILNCSYSGTYKSITLPKGTYKLECWGAQGGNGTASPSNDSQLFGGKGGYSYGIFSPTSDTVLYLYSGGQGSTATGSISSGPNGGYNGGGAGSKNGTNNSNTQTSGGGGGATHIATTSGLLNTLSSSTASILLIAGGGGGAGGWYGSFSTQSSDGGYGGGNSGGFAVNGEGYSVSGGTQSSGYSFGQGASASTHVDQGGGGGGYYGGYCSTGTLDSNICGGGGGSGYINTSKLTSASTIAGNTSFTSPTGSSETGHSGNGYIRITVQSISNWAYSTVSISAPTYSKQNTSSWTLSPNTCRYFSFTPTISGDFIVYSNSSIDTYGYLTSNITSLNSSGQPSSNILARDDDYAKKYGGTGANFGICYKVTAGTTYYIYVKPYHDSTANSSVYLTYYMAHPDSRVYVKTDSTTWKLITN